MIRWITTGLATGCLALAACVTINVYFPAAAAEKAADRIIEDIWGKEKAEAPAGNEQTSIAPPSRNLLARALQGIADFVVPVAHAQADLDVSSPAIRALTASMKARAGDLDPFFTSGAIGLTSDGLVEIRDANAVPLADRNRLRKLVRRRQRRPQLALSRDRDRERAPGMGSGHPQHLRRALDRECARPAGTTRRAAASGPRNDRGLRRRWRRLSLLPRSAPVPGSSAR